MQTQWRGTPFSSELSLRHDDGVLEWASSQELAALSHLEPSNLQKGAFFDGHVKLQKKNYVWLWLGYIKYCCRSTTITSCSEFY